MVSFSYILKIKTKSMTLKKINLSALQNKAPLSETQSETQTAPTPTSITTQAQETVTSVAPKISLKALQSHTPPQEETQTEKVSEEKIETQLPDLSSKQVNISDGDTQVNIVMEEKSEIFGSYDGSYREGKKVSPKVIQEAPQESVALMTQKQEPIRENTPQAQPEVSQTKISKKSSKKIWYYTGTASAVLSLGLVYIFWSQMLTSNVLQSDLPPTTPVLQEELTPQEETQIETSLDQTQPTEEIQESSQVIEEISLPDQTENIAAKNDEETSIEPSFTDQEVGEETENIIPTLPAAETTQPQPESLPNLDESENSEIVKENTGEIIENTQNLDIMKDEILHNRLLKKYKK